MVTLNETFLARPSITRGGLVWAISPTNKNTPLLMAMRENAEAMRMESGLHHSLSCSCMYLPPIVDYDQAFKWAAQEITTFAKNRNYAHVQHTAGTGDGHYNKGFIYSEGVKPKKIATLTVNMGKTAGRITIKIDGALPARWPIMVQ